MRSAPKYIAIGVGAGLALGAAGIASAGSGSGGTTYQAYARYIDAGNTTAPIVVGKRTWETQTGFVGGTASTSDFAWPTFGLSPQVARTVLTGPSSFSLAIPNGQYRVVMWVRNAHRAPVSAEGKAATTMKTIASGRIGHRGWHRSWRQAGLPVTVTDGSLDLQFPAGNTMRVAALAIEGRAEVAGTPTSSPTSAPTSTATTPPTPTSTVTSTAPPTSTTKTSTTAPTTTTSSSAPSSSPSKSCTNPKFTTSDTNGGWSVGGYYVHNNMWNASEAGPETLYACNYDNWYVTSTQGGSDPTAVKTYPNVHKDYDDVPISSFKSLTSTFAATSPHTGIYDVAYDIWLNGVADNNSTEMMIWTDNYKQVPAGDVATTVTLGGVSYDVWKESDNKYIAFVPKSPMTSGQVDLLEIFKWTMSKGWLKTSSTVGQIDYGVEICSTNNKPATFNFTDFSISES